MPIIGPTFSEELTAAGVADRRFTWSPGTGQINFDPDMPAAERAKVEAVLKAHDGALSEARHQALEATSAEAAKRIADMFGRPPGSEKLIFAEINALGRAVQILNKKIEGTALPEERLEIEALDGIYGRAGAILEAGDAAKAALQAAKNVGEVEAVRPAWPRD